MTTRILFLSLILSSTALASAIQPGDESYSRALQQAKRVAALENDQSIPAPAVKVSQRVAKNSQKLAFRAKKAAPKAEPKKQSAQ